MDPCFIHRHTSQQKLVRICLKRVQISTRHVPPCVLWSTVRSLGTQRAESFLISRPSVRMEWTVSWGNHRHDGHSRRNNVFWTYATAMVLICLRTTSLGAFWIAKDASFFIQTMKILIRLRECGGWLILVFLGRTSEGTFPHVEAFLAPSASVTDSDGPDQPAHWSEPSLSAYVQKTIFHPLRSFCDNPFCTYLI